MNGAEYIIQPTVITVQRRARIQLSHVKLQIYVACLARNHASFLRYLGSSSWQPRISMRSRGAGTNFCLAGLPAHGVRVLYGCQDRSTKSVVSASTGRRVPLSTQQYHLTPTGSHSATETSSDLETIFQRNYRCEKQLYLSSDRCRPSIGKRDESGDPFILLSLFASGEEGHAGLRPIKRRWDVGQSWQAGVLCILYHKAPCSPA